MEKFKIVIANDFSITPGGRWKKLGPSSGEEFYEKLLLPKYIDSLNGAEKLHIYLDGVKSYPYSFLDQSFGELARIKGAKVVNDNIIFHTNLFYWVVKYIKDEIWFKEQ